MKRLLFSRMWVFLFVLAVGAVSSAQAATITKSFTQTTETPPTSFPVTPGVTTPLFSEVTVTAADLIGSTDGILEVEITIHLLKPEDTPGFGDNAGDIVLTLTGPAASVNLVEASTYESTGGAKDVTITFDDDAAGPVGGTTTPRTLQSGQFQPVGTLSVFDTQSALGTWRLALQDIGIPDLTVVSAELSITLNNAPTTTAVPEPSSLALLGIGALGLIGYRRRNRTTTSA